MNPDVVRAALARSLWMQWAKFGVARAAARGACDVAHIAVVKKSPDEDRQIHDQRGLNSVEDWLYHAPQSLCRESP